MKKSTKPTDELIEHWYTLISAQQFQAREFYDHIEDAILEQKVPALDISRVDLSEGGVLSDKREYLRMQRERIIFDICGAPVGVNYFFSYRFYTLPAVVKWWEIAIVLVVVGCLFEGSSRYIGPALGPMLLFAAVVILVWMMRNAIGLGLRDVDASLLKLPVIGPIYERFFRKDSYYRQDTRIAYCSIVSGIVKQEVARITAEKGVQLLREFTCSPVFKDLYRAKETPLSPAAEPEPVSA
jgi:hypothetical protein